MQSLLVTIAGLLLAFPPLLPSASANTEEPVASPFGGTPYMIVVADDVGSAKGDPGLYARDPDSGKWVLAFPGQVQSPSRAGGLALHLATTKKTGLFEGVAVIDGKIMLFNTDSSLRDPESYLVIGGDRAPVGDPWDGSQIAIPPIANASDVSFSATTLRDATGEREVVQVSIRQPSPLGDGITFAFTVENGRKLAFDPVLLSWTFEDPAFLAGNTLPFDPATKRAAAVGSPLLLRKLAAGRKNDPEVLKRWRKQLASLLAERRHLSELDSETAAGLPLLAAASGTLEIASLPHAPTQSELPRFKGAQAVYDPVESRSGLYPAGAAISLSEIQNAIPIAAGEFACDEKACLTEDLGPSHSAYRMRDGRIVLATLKAANPQPITHISVIDPADSGEAEQIDRRSFKGASVVWLSESGSDGVALVSWDFGGKGDRTAAAVFKDSKLVSVTRVSDRFFPQAILLKRTSVYTINGQNTQAVDLETSLDVPPDLYSNGHNLSLLHVIVPATLSAGKPVLSPVAPIFIHNITPTLVYLEFNEDHGRAGAGEIRSGIYRTGTGLSQKVFSGKLSVTDTHGNTTFPVAEEREFDFRGGKVTVTLVQYDPDPKSQTGQIDLLGIVNSKEGNATSTVLNFMNLRKENVQGYIFAPQAPRAAKSKNADTLDVSFGVLQKGSTILASYALSQKPDGSWQRGSSQNYAVRIGMGPEEFTQRVRLDHEHFYFVMSPTLEQTSSQFQLLKVTPQQINGAPTRNSKGEVIYYDSWTPSAEEADRFLRGGDGYRSEGLWKVRAEYPVGPVREVIGRTKGNADYRMDIFPGLRKLLNDLADPGQPAQHVFLVVPPDVAAWASEYPIAAWLRPAASGPAGQKAAWSARNPDLSLYYAESKNVDQRDVFDNIEAAVRLSQGGKRSVLFSTAPTLSQVGRAPAPSGEAAFLISEKKMVQPAANSAASGGALGDPKSETTVSEVPPHILYLMSNEGERVALTDFQAFQASRFKPQVSMLVVGTQQQFDDLRKQADVEERRALFDYWKTVSLGGSDRSMRTEMLTGLLGSPEIRELGYRFDAGAIIRNRPAASITQEEALAAIAEYVNNRTESLATQNGTSSFSGFLRVMTALREDLWNNASSRRRGVVDLSLVETVMAKIFPMALQLALLPPDDPLKILSNPRAPLEWQAAGYSGPLAIRRLVIQTILSQLNDDGVRNVPSSFILYGGSGSGKTSLVKTLFKLMGLKEFDLNSDDAANAQAGAFYLHMQSVIEDSALKGGEKPPQGTMRVSDALAQLDRALALPNGPRMFIFLDDFHKAGPEVRKAFLAKLSTFFENRFYQARNTMIPTHNLIIGMALNPTEDHSQITKFTADKAKGPTDSEIILATLAENGVPVESSFLNRFNRVLNLATFPASAKGPKLIETAEKVAMSPMVTSGTLILVTNEAVDDVVNRFPDMNARAFLTAGSRALTQVPDRAPSNLFVVVPSHVVDPDAPTPAGIPLGGESSFFATGKTDEAQLEEFVRRTTVRLPIDASPQGRLVFMKFLMDNFRKAVLATLLQTATDHPDVIGNANHDHLIAIPLARAIYDEIEAYPELPLSDVIFAPTAFAGADQGMAEQYRSAWTSLKASQAKRALARPAVGGVTLSALVDPTESTRSSVLRQHALALEEVTSRLLAAWFRIDDSSKTPDPLDWIRALPDADPSLVSVAGTAFFDDLYGFQAGIFARDVIRHAKESGMNPSLNQYEAMRLYVMAVNRAISRMPWARITDFAIKALGAVTGDLTFAQSPHVQHLLFKSKATPFIPIDTGIVLEAARSIPGFETQATGSAPSGSPEAASKTRNEKFVSNCESLFVAPPPPALGGGSDGNGTEGGTP